MKPILKASLIKLISAGILFYTSYGLSNHSATSLDYVPEITFTWERNIPSWAWTIVPYWSLNLMYAAAFFLCRDTHEQNRHVAHLVAVQLVVAPCSALFPLCFGWSKPSADGLSGWLFGSLAAFDLPYSQMPSLHITLVAIVGAFYWTRFPKIRLPFFLWQGLIALSVLTTYQHHFIGVPTGILLGWLVSWAFLHQMASPLKLGLSHARSRKIALLYLLGACLTVLSALLSGAWLWLIWVSMSLLMVAFAYLTGSANVLQKQANGKLSAVTTVLLLPYLVSVQLDMAYWLRGKAKTIPVHRNVWIGSILGTSNRQPAVLDVCAEYPCRSR